MSAHQFGIWPPYEAFYIRSMLFNAESAMTSIHHVGDALTVIGDMSPAEFQRDVDSHSLLDELQNIVVQGAALCRYFWPVRQKPVHLRRGEALRVAFNVDDTSPLKSRDLRNAIEHFDERLDDFLGQPAAGQFFPEYVGPRPPSNGVPIHVFRAFYLDTGVFALLGTEYEMQPLVDEIARVYQALICSEGHGGRLQVPPEDPSAGTATESPLTEG